MQQLIQVPLWYAIPFGFICFAAGFFLASFFLAGKDPNDLKYPEVELDAHERAIAG